MRAFLTGLTVVVALSVAAFAVQPPSSQPHDLRTSSGLASFTSSPALTFAAGHQRQVVAYLKQLKADQDAAAARLAAIAAARARPHPRVEYDHDTAGASAGEFAPSSFLDCVRERESRGQYGVSDGGDGGEGNYGAFQFSQSTWNNTARHAGRLDLVGVNPASASPSDQDAMAAHLLGWQGTAPWSGGSHPC